MGRFGISFSNENAAGFKIDRRQHYATVTKNSERKDKDGPFQRCLAWCSYFVMVFVAICTFNSPAIAGVVQIAGVPIVNVNPSIEQNAWAIQDQDGNSWVLRGTR